MRWIVLILPILLLGCAGAPAQGEENTTHVVIVENETEIVQVNETEEPEPNVTVEEPPVAVMLETCKDSDGSDIYTKGNVTAFKNFFEDSCEGLKVREYRCSEGEATYSVLDCPEGFICKDARCVRGMPKCTDTDGGYDIYVAGELVIDSLIDATYLDKCLSDKRMREYYCENDGLVQKDVECDIRCMQGRCLKQ